MEGVIGELGFDIPCHVERLSNGLTVLIAPQPGVPVVTVDVTYDVGSRVEEPGRTGLAHLFEHLMFEGSENVEKGEHFRIVAEAGGVMNGTTSEDRTNYFETLPAEALDIGLFLEADRMRSLVVSKEKLDNQREAVKEEKRLRIDNQPYATSFEAADSLVYDTFPYRHPVIGSMEDLDLATLEDASGFYRRYYAPANALLCVAGDVDVADAFGRVRRYFNEVPERLPPDPFVCEEPVTATRREAQLVDPHAAVPGLHVAFKVPRRRDPALRGLAYVERILAGGESGKLWRRLVKDEEKALSLSVSLEERRGPSMFRFFALARPGTTLEALEAEILGELSRFAAEGPTPREMARVKRTFAADAVRSTQTTQAIAFLLSEYGLFDRAPGLWREDFEALLETDAASVRAAAAEWLNPSRAAIIQVVPGREPHHATGPQPPVLAEADAD